MNQSSTRLSLLTYFKPFIQTLLRYIRLLFLHRRLTQNAFYKWVQTWKASWLSLTCMIWLMSPKITKYIKGLLSPRRPVIIRSRFCTFTFCKEHIISIGNAIYERIQERICRLGICFADERFASKYTFNFLKFSFSPFKSDLRNRTSMYFCTALYRLDRLSE